MLICSNPGFRIRNTSLSFQISLLSSYRIQWGGIMSVNLKNEIKSLDQRAYEVIKDMILSGELKHNIRLTEGKMAEELGVSRTPVKKAFIRLKEEYLLDEAPSQGGERRH